MKIRDLTRKTGSVTIAAWPPTAWAGYIGSGDTLPGPEDGVLQSVRRVGGHRLSLTMLYEGRDHMGGVEWTPPPSVDAVERVLRASVGQAIRAIGDLEV